MNAVFIIVIALWGLLPLGAWVYASGSSMYDRGGARLLATGLTALWLALSGLSYWFSYGTEEHVTLTVERTERIAEDGDGKWVVYALNGETFENSDAWFHGKTTATDLQRELKAGHTYRCLVNGKRIGLLSMYRNVLNCEEVPA